MYVKKSGLDINQEIYNLGYDPEEVTERGVNGFSSGDLASFDTYLYSVIASGLLKYVDLPGTPYRYSMSEDVTKRGRAQWEEDLKELAIKFSVLSSEFTGEREELRKEAMKELTEMLPDLWW